MTSLDTAMQVFFTQVATRIGKELNLSQEFKELQCCYIIVWGRGEWILQSTAIKTKHSYSIHETTQFCAGPGYSQITISFNWIMPPDNQKIKMNLRKDITICLVPPHFHKLVVYSPGCSQSTTIKWVFSKNFYNITYRNLLTRK